MFSRLYPDHHIQQYCNVVGAKERFRISEETLQKMVGRVHQIELMLKSGAKAERNRELVEELRNLYRVTFEAFKLKGILEGLHSSGP